MSEENPKVEEETVEEQNISFSFGEEAISPICLVGEINDENTSAVISALVMNKVIAEKIEEPEPMEFYLNSEGGSA
jgi:ATP-dependent protease ClpP protease subunit